MWNALLSSIVFIICIYALRGEKKDRFYCHYCLTTDFDSDDCSETIPKAAKRLCKKGEICATILVAVTNERKEQTGMLKRQCISSENPEKAVRNYFVKIEGDYRGYYVKGVRVYYCDYEFCNSGKYTRASIWYWAKNNSFFSISNISTGNPIVILGSILPSLYFATYV